MSIISIKRNHLKPRRNIKVKANCVFVFVFFHLKNLQTENFVNCFVVCFDIRGLAKNKEGKDLESILITCTAEMRKMRVTMKMRSYEYKNCTKTKERLFLKEKIFLNTTAMKKILRMRALPLSKCGYVWLL